MVEEEAYHALVRYVGLLVHWNRAYNLTSVQDPIEIVRRHILDCLVILPYIRGTRLLDLGTGAGFPGIILAITRPDMECVLLDGNGKKTRFCIQVATELELPNVEVLRIRAEKYVAEVPFTTITARAFGSLSVLWNHAERLLAPDGRLLAMKGTMTGIIKDIANSEELGKRMPKVASHAENLSRYADSPENIHFPHSAFISGKSRIVALSVPCLFAERHLVIVEHTLTT